MSVSAPPPPFFLEILLSHKTCLGKEKKKGLGYLFSMAGTVRSKSQPRYSNSCQKAALLAGVLSENNKIQGGSEDSFIGRKPSKLSDSY